MLLDKCWISLIDITTAAASSWIRLSYYLLWAPLVTRGGVVTREGVVIVGVAAVRILELRSLGGMVGVGGVAGVGVLVGVRGGRRCGRSRMCDRCMCGCSRSVFICEQKFI